MLNRYNFNFNEKSNTYNFTTKNAIQYSIAFVVDETFSTISGEEITGIYQLVIEKISDEIEPFDAKVSKTIEKIIEQFFENEQNSLIYVCSEDNRKAKTRQNTFNRWYNNSRCKNKIKKIDNVIHFEVNDSDLQKVYTSFLFHINNTNQVKLIEIYAQIERILNEGK